MDDGGKSLSAAATSQGLLANHQKLGIGKKRFSVQVSEGALSTS